MLTPILKVVREGPPLWYVIVTPFVVGFLVAKLFQ